MYAGLDRAASPLLLQLPLTRDNGQTTHSVLAGTQATLYYNASRAASVDLDLWFSYSSEIVPQGTPLLHTFVAAVPSRERLS